MKKLSVFLALISLTFVFICSCQKDKTYQAGESNNLKTTVSGIVLDESNAPLNGVSISAYGQTTTTNQYGTFVLKNIYLNKDRCVLQFTKTGFFKRAEGFIPSGNTVNYVRIVLISNAATFTFPAAAPFTVTLPDNSSATFQANSFVTANGSAYTGTVNLTIKHLSPDDANFGFMIPGGDLLGKDLNDKDVALYTYGMLGVELTGSSGE
ncbi:MAG: carboxypeptidase-like regulatory domain-containing protein, partial [Bacteroidota bacterium]